MLVSHIKIGCEAKSIYTVLLLFLFCLGHSLLFAQGNILWSKSYGGNANDIAEDIIYTSDNSLLIVGYSFSNNQDVAQNLGGADIWVLKTDFDGNILWSKTFGTNANEYGHSIVDAGNDEYIIAGTSHANGNGKGDGYLLKIDHDGNQIWEQHLGGERFDGFSKIVAAANQNFLVSGTSNSKEAAPNSGFGQGDIWVLNIDNNGSINWEYNFGGSRSDIVEDLLQTPDGSIYLTGMTFSQDGHFLPNSSRMEDAFILKLDANGIFQWSRKYSSDTPDAFQALAQASNGNLVSFGFEGIQNTTTSGIQGRFNQNMLLQEFDPSGQVQWTRQYGGSRIDEGNALYASYDGGYILSGTSQSFDGDINAPKGKKDVWIGKIDASGILEWKRNIGGSDSDKAKAIVQTPEGHYYALGDSYSDDGNLTNNRGSEDIFLTKIEGSFILTLDLGTDQNICEGESITITALAPNCGGCSYQWSDGFSGSSRNLTPTQNLSYTVTVSDQSNNMAVDNITITVNPIPMVSAQTSDLACNGQNTGSITLNTSAGTPPFSYNWNNGATSSTLQNLSASNYTVTISDNANCTTSQFFNLTEPAAIGLNLQTQNISCSGQLGQINTNVQGGSQPYSYQWNTGSTQQNLDNLSSGFYELTLTDNNNCTAVQSTEIDETTAINLNIQAQNVSCFGQSNGSISTNVQGGSQPYIFQWSNGSNLSNLNNLPVGNYDLTLTDANNCTASQTINITENPEIQLSFQSQNVACFGEQTGQISSQIQGGVLPYSFQWSNGSSAPNLYDIAAGQYQLTLTDANGCSVNEIIEITQVQALGVNLFPQDISCFGEQNGEITSIVQGGNTPYFYEWSNGSTSQNPTNLPAGPYTLTLIDNNNCSQTASVEINEPTSIELTSEVQNIACFGNQDGAVQTSVQGGNPPYSYQWSNGSTNPNLADLPAGQYNLVLSDNNACTSSLSVNIVESFPLQISFQTQDINCSGQESGQILTNPQGGNPPYSFNWNNGSSTQNIENLNAGLYELTLTDSNNCTQVESVEIFQATEFEVDIVPTFVNCFGDETGQITTNISGGNPPYTFDWNNGSDAQNLNNLAAGTYELTISDMTDCAVSFFVEIQEPDSIEISLTPQEINCSGDGNGQIISFVVGGNPPYNYEWSNGETSQNILNLEADNYELTLTDNNNCVQTISQAIVEPNPLNITANINPLLCHNAINASIQVNISGGTGIYSSQWNTADTLLFIDNLAEGVYSISVSDENDCLAEESYTITEPDSLYIISSFVHPSNGMSNGSINLDLFGGTPPLNIEWSNGAMGNNLIDLAEGVYSYTITDANACVLVDYIVLENMVSTENIRKNEAIEIFPNPSSGQVFFKSTNNTFPVFSTQIYNSKGQFLFEKAFQLESEKSLRLDDYPSGIYFIRLHTNEGTWVERIVRM